MGKKALLRNPKEFRSFIERAEVEPRIRSNSDLYFHTLTPCYVPGTRLEVSIRDE